LCPILCPHSVKFRRFVTQWDTVARLYQRCRSYDRLEDSRGFKVLHRLRVVKRLRRAQNQRRSQGEARQLPDAP
jgi:hypothetical protein